MLQHTHVIRVYYAQGPKKLFVGRLALINRKIFFEYSSDFLKTGLELSPFKLPLKAGIVPSEDSLFDGLFGVFNDSLPDGWGRLLLDRKLMQLGINPAELTAIDRLRYVGNRGMGALSYEPEIEHFISPRILHNTDLDDIAKECLQFQECDGSQFVDDLLEMNGSSAGARPKILVNLIKDSLQVSDNNMSVQHNDWIIKFRSIADPQDIGPIEYAYHTMALAAGLEVSEAKLFESRKGLGYFGTKRFDRVGVGADAKFLHMHTISGLLHADHSIPSLDYETIMKVSLWLTKDIREYTKQFRNIVFNVLAHNRDDHAKNFSYLMDEAGVWRISPAYDLTFSSGPAGEHCTTVMGEGKNPKLAHLLKLAKIASIKQSTALEIIEEVKSAVSKWRDFAKHANVTKQSSSMIQKTLERVSKNFCA